MEDATYVVFAPTSKRGLMREHFAQGSHHERLRWREQKRFGGSEFYISGPPAAAREAHRTAVLRLSREEAPY